MKSAYCLLFLVVMVVGCSPAEPEVATSVDQASVKNEPDGKAGQGAAYRIVPSNPEDSRFKADPKLAGGG